MPNVGVMKPHPKVKAGVKKSTLLARRWVASHGVDVVPVNRAQRRALKKANKAVQQ